MSLVRKVRASLQRQAQRSVTQVMRNVLRSVAAAAMAPVVLRGCDAVGSFARTFGVPVIDNRGRIEVGDHFALNCAFVPVELRTEERGSILIGNGVGINFGTVVSASGAITIGNGVSIGPYCIIGDPNALESTPGAPIEIGDGVWLAARVTIRPGARIGEHAVISAGAVVTGDVPPHAVVGGVPAKVLRVYSKTTLRGAA